MQSGIVAGNNRYAVWRRKPLLYRAAAHSVYQMRTLSKRWETMKHNSVTTMIISFFSTQKSTLGSSISSSRSDIVATDWSYYNFAWLRYELWVHWLRALKPVRYSAFKYLWYPEIRLSTGSQFRWCQPAPHFYNSWQFSSSRLDSIIPDWVHPSQNRKYLIRTNHSNSP